MSQQSTLKEIIAREPLYITDIHQIADLIELANIAAEHNNFLVIKNHENYSLKDLDMLIDLGKGMVTIRK